MLRDSPHFAQRAQAESSYARVIMSQYQGSVAGVARLLREVETLLKHPSITVELGHRGVNASITLLAVQGLTAYVEGNRMQAYQDFVTVTEELRARTIGS